MTPGDDVWWAATWSRACGVGTSATSEEESRALARAALACPPGWAVELGCWQGRTAAVLGSAAAARKDLRIATVDPFVLYQDVTGGATPADPESVRSRLRDAGLADWVEVRQGSSIEVARAWDPARPVSLLFVDADHHEDAVRADWEAWRSHLAPGAIVAWHDCEAAEGWDARPWAGVRRAVDAILASGDLDRGEQTGVLLLTRVAFR